MSDGGDRLERQPFEERRVADVGRVVVPLEPLARRARQRSPSVVAVEHVRVLGPEHLRLHRLQHRLLDFALGRPDVLQKDRLAVAIRAERFRRQVDLHLPGERVRHDERRRRQVVGAHLRLDASLEIPVAAQHRGDDEVPVLDDARHRFRQRAAVADARGAAVADDVEAELGEILEQPGRLVILGDDQRAGREARLHPGLHLQPALDGVAREQAGADHHARVRRVRAARDRGDDDRAVIEPLHAGNDVGCGSDGR